MYESSKQSRKKKHHNIQNHKRTLEKEISTKRHEHKQHTRDTHKQHTTDTHKQHTTDTHIIPETTNNIQSSMNMHDVIHISVICCSIIMYLYIIYNVLTRSAI